MAFCQFVPAAGIDGFSLDLMRRAGGQHPNGLTDFLVVRTIEHLRDEGRRGLGLNFATMRAVLAGEMSDSMTTRLGRRLLLRMSDDMQIESLWRFSAKFDPAWRPRYVVLDGARAGLRHGPGHRPGGVVLGAARRRPLLPALDRLRLTDHPRGRQLRRRMKADGVVPWSDRMMCITALIRARWVKACGKLPRWRPLWGSISSA